MTEGLTLRTWNVQAISSAPTLRLEAGLLQVDVAELEGLAIPPIVGLDVHLVSPGDPVRLTHVLDAVIPTIKVGERGTTFPRIPGRAIPAGRGVTNRLAGICVVSVADLGPLALASGDPSEGESLIDMSGPGAEACPFSATHNVVLVFRLEAGADLAQADAAIRSVTLEAAVRLSAATLSAGEPDRVEERVHGAVNPDLPTIAAILQVASEGPANDTLLYGEPMVRAPVQTIGPGEVLDGALVNAAYDYAGLRNVTAFYQDNALIRTLWDQHGSRLNFGGVILTLAYLDDPEDKRVWAENTADLAEALGADGVVMTSFQSGNSHTDVMLTIRACEARGIRTAAIVSETDAGLVDMVTEADALVSSGNEDQLLEPWEPNALIGPAFFNDGTSALVGRRLPIVAFLGAIEQTGGSRVRAVTL